ncbi:hypothetical protein [Nannocystis pusilla]|uniref:Uncharacterized protein n=1 Tax=Nannocystis pusilla TaxID=889268 RepID=A0ABS7TSD4_9BACT|nr:hypothetical protein [Nannocystis pusilla]MBZ5711144.1 hypothetical protein [Nannocystis pusilla]
MPKRVAPRRRRDLLREALAAGTTTTSSESRAGRRGPRPEVLAPAPAPPARGGPARSPDPYRDRHCRDVDERRGW